MRHSASYLRYEFEIVTRTGSSNQFDLNALNAVASKQFANNSDFAVSEETVKKMSEVGSVEAFSLSHFHADSSVQDWDKKVVLISTLYLYAPLMHLRLLMSHPGVTVP